MYDLTKPSRIITNMAVQYCENEIDMKRKLKLLKTSIPSFMQLESIQDYEEEKPQLNEEYCMFVRYDEYNKTGF